MREPDLDYANQHLEEEVLKYDFFQLLRENLGENIDSFFYEKVVHVPGDVSRENRRGTRFYFEG